MIAEAINNMAEPKLINRTLLAKMGYPIIGKEISKMQKFSWMYLVPILIIITISYAIAGEEKEPEEIQDMSDPLAVYTQVGAGVTNKGINIKVGKTYDSGDPNRMAMNVVEIKGALGEVVGWDGSSKRDDSIDSFRFRNLQVDMTNGRGSQLDINYLFDGNHLAEQSGDISYGFIQALPKMGPFNFYPLAGAGVAFGNNVLEDDGRIDSGYSIYGSFALIGMYAKAAITDKFWINYNPFWLATLSGSDLYKDNAYGQNEDNLLTHEFIISYQFTPRFNVRAFANWNENVDISDGDHRIEFNYQL